MKFLQVYSQDFPTNFVYFLTKNLGKFCFSCVNFTNFPVFWEKFAKFFISQIRKRRKEKPDAEEDGFSPSPSIMTRICQLIMIGTL